MLLGVQKYFERVPVQSLVLCQLMPTTPEHPPEIHNWNNKLVSSDATVGPAVARKYYWCADLFTSMVCGKNARFLRGRRMGFCPHNRTAIVWTAISMSAPLLLKLWGSTLRTDGSAFITRDVAKFCRSGGLRALEFWMNSVRARVCWKHILKRNKTTVLLPIKPGRISSCFSCCIFPHFENTFPLPWPGHKPEQKVLPPMISISLFLTNKAYLSQAPKGQYLTCCLGWKLESLNPYRAVTSLKTARSRWTDRTAVVLPEAWKRQTHDRVEKRWPLWWLNAHKVSAGYWTSKLQLPQAKATQACPLQRDTTNTNA